MLNTLLTPCLGQVDSLTQELEGKAGVPGRPAPPVNNNNPSLSTRMESINI